MSKSILYYTCNTHPEDIEQKCRAQLAKAGLPIISVSLGKEIEFGDERIVMQGARSAKSMHAQIVLGLVHTKTDYVFLCENDVLYHPSHFDFTPPRDDTFYYNTNVYKVWGDGHIVWTDDLQQISGLCGSTELMHDFFTRRFLEIRKDGDNRHYEPHERYGCRVENWQSATPNIDIRHGKNFTRSHRTAEEFRNPKYARGFKVVDSVPGWEGGF